MESYQGESKFSNNFNRLAHQISSQIQQITKNVSQISRMVAMLGTSQDSDDLRQKLHEIQHTTHSLSKTTMESLQSLTAMNPPMSSGADQVRQCKLQRERLMNDFSVVLNNFQSTQRTAALKEKASVSRARAGTGITGQDPFGSQTQAAATGVQMNLQLEQNVDVETLRERENALRQLESDIVDVNQIFKDLAVMVHEQGEVVDSIEANVDNAVLHTDRGTSNIRQAADYQRRARRKQLCCTLWIAIVIIILALIIYFSTRHSNTER